MLNKFGKESFALLIFFIAAVFITYPLIFKLGSLTTGYGDEFLIAWIHNWVINSSSSLSGIIHIFDTNIFFPYKNSLAFSETFITTSLIAAPFLQIFKSPIATVNINIFLSLVLVGFSTYLLTNLLTKDKLISIFAGSLILFCPAYLGQFTHLQIIAIYFVPLSIYFLLKFLENKKERYFIFFLISFVAQTYNSFLPGYFIAFATALIVSFFILENRKGFNFIFAKKNIILVIVSLTFIAIIAIPYFRVSKEFNYKRDIKETIHFALQPEDFLVASDQSRFQSLLSNLSFTKDLSGKGEIKPAFLGATFSILIILSLIYFLKNWKKQNYITKSIFAISILGIVLSLGPFLHLQRQTIHEPFPIPLPYLIFYYIIPGFQGIRNSARFEFLFILFSAPLIAVFLKENLNKLNMNKNLIVLILILAAISEFNFPFKYYSVPQPREFPKVYSYLSQTPRPTVIIEMPIYNWNVIPYSSQEFFREYYSTIHFRKTVNGVSGFSPPVWQDFVMSQLANFPSEESIGELKKIGVNLIIVHKKEYNKLHNDEYTAQNKKIPNGDFVVSFLLKDKNVEFIKSFGEDYVFKIK